jgi:hypothetical protein
MSIKGFILYILTFVTFHFTVFFMGATYRSPLLDPAYVTSYKEVTVPYYLTVNPYPPSWLAWDGPAQYEPYWNFQKENYSNLSFPFWNSRSGIGGPFWAAGIESLLSPLGNIYALSPTKYWDYISLFWIFLAGLCIADIICLIGRRPKISSLDFLCGLALVHFGIIPNNIFVNGEVFNHLLAIYLLWSATNLFFKNKIWHLAVIIFTPYLVFTSGMPQQVLGIIALQVIVLFVLYRNAALSPRQAIASFIAGVLFFFPTAFTSTIYLSENYMVARDYSSHFIPIHEILRLFSPGFMFLADPKWGAEYSNFVGYFGFCFFSIIWFGRSFFYRFRNFSILLFLIAVTYLLLSYVPGLNQIVSGHLPFVKQARFFRAFEGLFFASLVLIFALAVNEDFNKNRKYVPLILLVICTLAILFTGLKNDKAIHALSIGILVSILILAIQFRKVTFVILLVVEAFFFLPRQGLHEILDHKLKRSFSAYFDNENTNFYRTIAREGAPRPIPEGHLSFRNQNFLAWIKPIYSKAANDFSPCANIWALSWNCELSFSESHLVGFIQQPCDRPIVDGFKRVSQDLDYCLYKTDKKLSPLANLNGQFFEMSDYVWEGPNQFKVVVNNSVESQFVFWETSSKLWSLHINGQKIEPVGLKNNLFNIWTLPAGEVHATLVYRPPFWPYLFFAPILGLLVFVYAVKSKKW